MDIEYANPKDTTQFNCSKCKMHRQKEMKCGRWDENDPLYYDFEALAKRRGKRVDKGGIAYNFCPGKATWFEDIHELYTQCMVAAETGILPNAGTLLEQPWEFYEVFPVYVNAIRHRKYSRTWSDVYEFTPKVLEQISKIIRSMFGK